MWQKSRIGAKGALWWALTEKLSSPTTKSSGKIVAEAFWPTTLDKESDKAARILRSFCQDGFYEEKLTEGVDGPKMKRKVLKKIPQEVIKNSKGMAIFTLLRAGLWISGSGGSGILVKRLPNGSWSPPSGILLNTSEVAALVGVDICDCVLLLNSDAAVSAFSKSKCIIGSNSSLSAIAGPINLGGVLDRDLSGVGSAPIFSYLKSKGFGAEVELIGAIVIEHAEENSRFYQRRIAAEDILAGKATPVPTETKRLMQALKAAQGDTHVDPLYITTEPSPSEFDLDDGRIFGVPDKEDPDPYGVLALAKEGLEIREAGSQRRVSRDSFTFNPSPTSPVFSTFNRSSIDGKLSQRSSWRTSLLSMTDRSSQTVDISTQTEIESNATTPQSASGCAKIAELPEDEALSHHHQVAQNSDTLTSSTSGAERTTETSTQTLRNAKSSPVQPDPAPTHLNMALQPTQLPTTTSSPSTVPSVPITPVTPTAVSLPTTTQPGPSTTTSVVSDHLSDYSDEEDYDEPVIHEVKQASPPQPIKARLVTVARRLPPALPPRSPARLRSRAHPGHATPRSVETVSITTIPSPKPSPSGAPSTEAASSITDSGSSVYSASIGAGSNSQAHSLASAGSRNRKYSVAGADADGDECDLDHALFVDFDETLIPALRYAQRSASASPSRSRHRAPREQSASPARSVRGGGLASATMSSQGGRGALRASEGGAMAAGPAPSVADQARLIRRKLLAAGGAVDSITPPASDEEREPPGQSDAESVVDDAQIRRPKPPRARTREVAALLQPLKTAVHVPAGVESPISEDVTPTVARMRGLEMGAGAAKEVEKVDSLLRSEEESPRRV